MNNNNRSVPTSNANSKKRTAEQVNSSRHRDEDILFGNGGATQERLQDAVHQRDEDEASVDDDLNNEESKSGSDD